MQLKYPNKKTKIVCTIGPASWDEQVMLEMIENGMDFARVNAAFADPAELQKVEELVRKYSPEVGLMLDVKGQEVRLNEFPEPIHLEINQQVIIGNSSEFEIYSANYPDAVNYIEVGDYLMIGDGEVKLAVVDKNADSIIAKVVYGELLSPGKALGLPDTELPSKALTDHDLELLNFIKTRPAWEYVSVSFVNSVEVADEVRAQLGDLKLIAKIEDAKGVLEIDHILPHVDGIMIARGGLGVEIGFEYIGLVQHYLLMKCKQAGKFSIAATQMLESMKNSPIPTRAESNDVSTAILLGADAVMLSAESTIGKFPVKAVEFMSEVDALLQKVHLDGSEFGRQEIAVDWEKFENLLKEKITS
jgi:pyruvate kinase